jgi:4a-hydroxytetrahydrobiopterin dehydratase
MPRLDDPAVEEGLQRLPGWERRGNEIVKTFVRKDFAHAMTFVNQVAGAAEAAGHHPDIRWNKVTLAPRQPCQGRADRKRLPTGRPHPGAGPAHPAHLTDRRGRIEGLDHQGVADRLGAELLDADSASHDLERRRYLERFGRDHEADLGTGWEAPPCPNQALPRPTSPASINVASGARRLTPVSTSGSRPSSTARPSRS